MVNTKSPVSKWESSVNKNMIHLNYWALAWVASIGLLGLGPQQLWNFDISITLMAILLNVSIGVRMIVVYRRAVRGQDEMQQKIFLEAAAMTLGILVVFGGSYQVWGAIQLISFEPQVWHLVSGAGLTFMICLIARTRKYQ